MIGERIRKLRRERNWTQKKLGQMAGIDQNNISQYESGKITPTRRTVDRLAEIFELSPDELLAEAPAEPVLAIEDPELLSLFREMSRLGESDRARLKWMLSLAVRQLRIQDVMQAS